MARITASVYTSHVPAIGAAIDMGVDSPSMAYEGILDRVKSVQSRKK